MNLQDFAALVTILSFLDKHCGRKIRKKLKYLVVDCVKWLIRELEKLIIWLTQEENEDALEDDEDDDKSYMVWWAVIS